MGAVAVAGKLSLCPAGRAAFAQAEERGYIVTCRGQWPAAWWAHCATWGLPFVRVRPRRRWAEITLDMFTTLGDLSIGAREAILDACCRAEAHRFAVSGGMVCVTVPVAVAEALAQCLFDLAWFATVLLESSLPLRERR